MRETENILPTSAHDNALPYLLNAISDYFKDFANQIDSDKELLSSGAKTELISQIEMILKNPLQQLSTSSQKINESANKLINSAVKLFFLENKEIIEYACRTNTSINLHYSILLREDTTENRQQIFRFFHSYDLQEFSRQFPVYFQFITPELKAEIPSNEIIIN
jgi:hypothetical protein